MRWSWIKDRIAAAKERPDDDIYLYDLYPFGLDIDLYWWHKGMWGIGFDVTPEALTATIGKLLIILKREIDL